MSQSPSDETLLLIRCPTCGQRFKVGEDLRDRTVECGGCEHRFRINEEVIVRSKKCYPGERSNPGLKHFQRVPLPSAETGSANLHGHHKKMPDPAVLEPVSPQRILAGTVGVAGMIVMALAMILGAKQGGLLDGVLFEKRMLMAGFAGLLGFTLLVYASPRARGKAVAIGLLMAMALVAIPFYFKEGSTRLAESADFEQLAEEISKSAVVDEGARTATDLKVQIGIGPLEAEISRLALVGGNKKAFGIWLRGLRESHRYLVRDFVIRVANASPATHYYPRDQGDYLLVVSETDKSLAELADLVAAVGEVIQIHTDLEVVEVRVSNEVFVEGAIEDLTNQDHPKFYELNKIELESIDVDRAKRAVQRLTGAPPKLFRVDINRKLISLLGEELVDFKPSIAAALMTWSDQPGLASAAVLKEVEKLHKNKKPVSREFIALMVQEKNTGILPILDELWFDNPTVWEGLYGDFGPAIESTVLKRFPETQGTIRYSAVRLLGRAGTVQSLPVLTAAVNGSDNELRVLLEQAQNSIRGRAGN